MLLDAPADATRLIPECVDLDGGGTLDAAEIKTATKTLHDFISTLQQQKVAVAKRVSYCTKRLGALDESLADSKRLEAVESELHACLHMPPVDARLGRALKSRLHSGKGGQKIADVAAKWQAQQAQQAAATAAPAAAATASGGGEAGEGEAVGVDANEGRIGRVAFAKLITGYKNIGDLRIDGTAAEVSVEIEKLFDALQSSDDGGAAFTPEQTTIDIGRALERLLAAAARQDERGVELKDEVAKVRAEAAMSQGLIVALDAEEVEAQAVAAEEVKLGREEAEAARVAREEAKRKAKEQSAEKARAALEEKEKLAAERREKMEVEVEEEKLALLRNEPRYLELKKAAIARGESLEGARKKGVRVWSGLAEDKLVEMASNLESGLKNDEQLRAIFKSIDLDSSGTIDRHEMEVALNAAGKKMSGEQIDAMMNMADEDKDGDIDYDEFANVLKAVKAANAALVMQRRFQDKVRAQAQNKWHVSAAPRAVAATALDDLGMGVLSDAATKVQASLKGKPAGGDGGSSKAKVATKALKKNARIWRGLAEDKLVEMASNLESGLKNDEQLRAIFKSIDLDSSGTIDRHEMEVALNAAGKKMSGEQIDAMMNMADEDKDGDIDYDEFANVLKAVKGSNAAMVLQRSFQHKKKTKGASAVKDDANAVSVS